MKEEAFTLGVEEEFQLVDRQTGELSSAIDRILEQSRTELGEHIKAELVQSAVELISSVHSSIQGVRDELSRHRTLLTRIVRKEGLALMSAGTHPLSPWQDQKITERERYFQLVEEQQDAIRAQVIFGLHVHVGIPDPERALRIMNQVRTWLPHLLALSGNSPFWGGRYTGIKSYRSLLWQGGPRSGITPIFSSHAELDQYIQDLQAVHFISGGGDIWWDVRLNAHFGTLEFRIFDMPATLEDTVALVALCQALVATLTWLDERNMQTQVLPGDYIMENKWQAVRYGLDAQIADFTKLCRLPLRESCAELLDFVAEAADVLGSRNEIEYLRSLLQKPDGTGADQQIAVYQKSGQVQDVVQYLLQQTMRGINP
ncbi:carboxylate-amine ligase [Tengunoibacter tsumagoiensis]|uniref:Putative glutamate--cysteine ligase 2 n=1 Tax=Tengunoibacter tsumagoiensis TaxID=2014871 RepID=A0A402AAT2_9CHLR|nr:carboxylate-amine ligase [Tengunoibacter tsumagoiensis]GCE16055.1 putative glutamate--cysteine ligase 2 [Tengunoibacter tsumagoiensis]